MMVCEGGKRRRLNDPTIYSLNSLDCDLILYIQEFNCDYTLAYVSKHGKEIVDAHFVQEGKKLMKDKVVRCIFPWHVEQFEMSGENILGLSPREYIGSLIYRIKLFKDIQHMCLRMLEEYYCGCYKFFVEETFYSHKYFIALLRQYADESIIELFKTNVSLNIFDVDYENKAELSDILQEKSELSMEVQADRVRCYLYDECKVSIYPICIVSVRYSKRDYSNHYYFVKEVSVAMPGRLRSDFPDGIFIPQAIKDICQFRDRYLSKDLPIFSEFSEGTCDRYLFSEDGRVFANYGGVLEEEGMMQLFNKKLFRMMIRENWRFWNFFKRYQLNNFEVQMEHLGNFVISLLIDTGLLGIEEYFRWDLSKERLEYLLLKYSERMIDSDPARRITYAEAARTVLNADVRDINLDVGLRSDFGK